MTEPIKKISAGTDADAEYVLRRIGEADAHEQEAKTAKNSVDTHRERAKAARREAGLRLVEVRERLLRESGLSGRSTKSPFAQWLRDNGIADSTASNLMRDAAMTEEEREAKRKAERERKKQQRNAAQPYRESWPDVLLRNAVIDPVLLKGGSEVGVRKKIEKAGIALPEGGYFDNAAGADNFALAYARAFPQEEQHKHALTKSDQKKVDRAVALEKERLQGLFEKEVYAEFHRREPELKAKSDQFLEENREETARYRILNATTRKILNADEYRFLLQVLHPDRAPAGREKQYARAFQIVQRLREYAEA